MYIYSYIIILIFLPGLLACCLLAQFHSGGFLAIKAVVIQMVFFYCILSHLKNIKTGLVSFAKCKKL